MKVVLLVIIQLVTTVTKITTQEIVFPVKVKKKDPCTVLGVSGVCVPRSECSEYRHLVAEIGLRPISCDLSSSLVCCPTAKILPDPVIDIKAQQYDTSKPPNEPFSCGAQRWFGLEDLSLYYQANRTAERLVQQGFKLSNFEILGGDSLWDFVFENDTYKGQYKREFPISAGGVGVGGQNARIILSPHMAIIGVKEGSNIDWYCDGVLINWNWVLTAAHCFKRTPNILRLGEYDLKSGPSSNSDPQDYEVKEFVLYPEYQFPASNHDLALIKLDRQTFIDRPDINPICLPWDENVIIPKLDDVVVLTGWGATEFGGPLSNILQEVNITVLDPSFCDSSYSTLRDYPTKFPAGIRQDTHICAGDVLGGKDACQGDSGGPIFYHGKRNRLTLAGIVSGGHGCGLKEFPGIYVPIHQPQYLDWIKKTAF